MTEDIHRAFPGKGVSKNVTRLDHNPLDPVYNLPKSKRRPETPLKFIRDHTDVSDILGASPSTINKWNGRNSLDISDIEGARNTE